MMTIGYIWSGIVSTVGPVSKGEVITGFGERIATDTVAISRP